jgi:hypothetical protein
MVAGGLSEPRRKETPLGWHPGRRGTQEPTMNRDDGSTSAPAGTRHDYRELYIDALSQELATAEDRIVTLTADCESYRLLVQVTLEQLAAANRTSARLRETLSEATRELRRLRPLVAWVHELQADEAAA